MNFMSIFRRMMVGLCLLSVFAAIPISAGVKREVRSVWMATVWALDWPSEIGGTAASQKAEITKYLDLLKADNFNAVYFQVRTMCDAFYKSSYEPWSSYLTGTRGKDPGWDPLAFVVEECHKRGMECHAWVNPYRFSTGSNWSTEQDQQLKSSGLLLTYEKTTILNPGLEGARKRIVDVCGEIVDNYDVDGIIFDDYFYPSGIPANSTADDYSLWQSSGSQMTFGDWRRANVNKMVADVYNMIQNKKPYVKFGISPAGAACTSAAVAAKHGIDKCPVASDWQYDGIFSDPVAWLEDGTIDYISPQLYWKTDHKTNPFGPMTKWWSYVAKHFGRHHYASHSISFLNSDGSNTVGDWEEIGEQLEFSREYTENSAPGQVFYSAAYITGKKKSGFGEWLLNNKYQYPALTPAIDWKKSEPEATQVSSFSKRQTILTWGGVPGMRYSIYAIPEGEGVSSEELPAEYLLGVSYTSTFTLPTDKKSGYNYAVCVLDRYGNEYPPVFYGDSGVDNVLGDDLVSATYEGGELMLDREVDKVVVYNEAGTTVGSAERCQRMKVSVPSGIYFVRIECGYGVNTMKIVVR